MDFFSACFAPPVATPEGDLAGRVGTYFGNLFAGGADDVGIFFSEAVEYDLELFVDVMLLTFFHCA
jgi:hypothetical protein